MPPKWQPRSDNFPESHREAVKADAGLQEKLNAAADADAVVAIAKAAGFVISAEELQRSQAGTISEEDLEGVVGGRPRDETHCTCNEPTTFPSPG